MYSASAVDKLLNYVSYGDMKEVTAHKLTGSLCAFFVNFTNYIFSIKVPYDFKVISFFKIVLYSQGLW